LYSISELKRLNKYIIMKKISEIYMYVLGGIVVLSFFFLIISLVKIEIPVPNEKVLYMAVGALIGSFNQVVSYFFGSSKGSKDKTDIISKNNGNAK